MFLRQFSSKNGFSRFYLQKELGTESKVSRHLLLDGVYKFTLRFYFYMGFCWQLLFSMFLTTCLSTLHWGFIEIANSSKMFPSAWKLYLKYYLVLVGTYPIKQLVFRKSVKLIEI